VGDPENSRVADGRVARSRNLLSCWQTVPEDSKRIQAQASQ